MIRWHWHQAGSGRKGLDVGSFDCSMGHQPKIEDDGYKSVCFAHVWFIIHPIEPHNLWQYDGEKYYVDRVERHRGGRWVETLGYARTQREGKDIAEARLNADYGDGEVR